MSNLSNKKKIDTSKYTNNETGETLESEIGEITSVNVLNQDYVKMKSDSFIIIDDKAVRYLQKILKSPEMSHLHRICTHVQGNMNVLVNALLDPHTKESLMRDLELARNAFNRLLAKLHKLGVIYYIDGYKDNRKVKHILLNPHLARRTNYISKECYKLFQTFEV